MAHHVHHPGHTHSHSKNELAEDTSFAWIGGTRAAVSFIAGCRARSCRFDHQRPANLAKVAADPKKPTQQHIHCVVRTPNGNDYGKDLLRQHYVAHPHKEA
jgi:hypothetical protein